jgi:hypothetical protein
MPVVILILNALLLAFALMTGIILFFWLAVLVVSMMAFLLIYQKITGRTIMRVYRFRHTTRSGPHIIDAEYKRIDEE